MRYLLDSHVFLWYNDGLSSLSRLHRTHLDDLQHELLLSAASLWELGIKRALGKLQFSGSFQAAARGMRVTLLPVTAEHAEAAEFLPRLHRDPFDHMLLAQAKAESLVLVTHDEQLQRYDVPILRV